MDLVAAGCCGDIGVNWWSIADLAWAPCTQRFFKTHSTPKVCLLLYVVQFNAAHWVVENPEFVGPDLNFQSTAKHMITRWTRNMDRAYMAMPHLFSLFISGLRGLRCTCIAGLQSCSRPDSTTEFAHGLECMGQKLQSQSAYGATAYSLRSSKGLVSCYPYAKSMLTCRPADRFSLDAYFHMDPHHCISMFAGSLFAPNSTVVKDWLIPTTMLMARNALRETRGWRLALRTHRLSEEKCPAPTIVWQVSDCCSMRCPYQPYLPPGCLAQVLRQWGLHARVDQIEEGKVDYTCDSWNDAKLPGWRIFSSIIQSILPIMGLYISIPWLPRVFWNYCIHYA